MTNIGYLELESIFNLKLDQIRETPWNTVRLLLLHELILFLEQNLTQTLIQSYKNEIFPIFDDTTERISADKYCSIDPTVLKKLISFFSTEILSNKEKQQFALNRLKSCLLKTYICLNEYDEILKCLYQFDWVKHSEDEKKSVKDFIRSNHKSETVYKSLFDIILYPKYKRFLEDIFEQHLFMPNNSLNGLFVVSNGKISTGIITNITLREIQIIDGFSEDQINISSHLIVEKNVLSDQMYDICRYLRSTHNLKSGSGLKLDYHIDQPTTTLSGNSVGLSLGFLAHLALNQYGTNHSFNRYVYNDVAFTGGLTSHGKVIEVDESSLKLKIETAFFSPINTVVLPAGQLAVCESHVMNLQKVYPERSLKLMPADNIRELSEHREIVTIQRRKITSIITQIIKTYANSVTLIIIAFILACAAGFYYGIVKHPVPDYITFEDQYFHIRNKFGFEMWKSAMMTKRIIHDKEYSEKTKNKLSIILDLTGSKDKNILIGYRYNSDPDASGHLICYTASGSKIWDFNIGMPVVFGENEYQDQFGINEIKCVDLNRDGNMEIIAVGSHIFFPTRIVLLSHDGELISDYWHSGIIGNIEIMDLYPGNSNTEIILTGTNNEYNTGVLVALDPYLMSGSSPQKQGYYTMSNSNPGTEMYYLRFPKSPFNIRGGRDELKTISVHENIITAQIHIKNKGISYYELSNELRVTFFDLTDGFYTTYASMVLDEPLPEYNDPELKKYFRAIDYWDGDKWVKEPTMNRRYLESLNP